VPCSARARAALLSGGKDDDGKDIRVINEVNESMLLMGTATSEAR